MSKLAAQNPEHERIVAFYTDLVNQFGSDFRALGWGSRKSQELRFAVLSQIGPLEGTSVLDVGCGLADLLAYFHQKEFHLDYTGYDLTPDMITLAKQRFPKNSFHVKDILRDLPCESARFDYVFASGIFSLRQKNSLAYLQAMAQRMFALCRQGVAFNTLSTQAPEQHPNEFYADPGEVLKICLDITPRVVIRHDYMVHDFTIYLYNEPESQ
jgi:ubiquinone/menaquinone biosynthesis C-methylase UbiE